MCCSVEGVLHLESEGRSSQGYDKEFLCCKKEEDIFFSLLVVKWTAR